MLKSLAAFTTAGCLLLVGASSELSDVHRGDLRVRKPARHAALCARAVYCGDFETGDYSQYVHQQFSEGPWARQTGTYTIDKVGHSEADIVTSPVKQGTYASRCTIRPTTGTSASDRCEVVAGVPTGSSRTWFYGWWTYFPGPSQDWWPRHADYNDWTQLGQYPNGTDWIRFGIDATSRTVARYGAPALFAEGPGLPYCSSCSRNKKYFGAIRYGHWYHVIVEARWSHDPSLGHVKIWIDGKVASPETYAATLTGTATSVDVSQGIYRAAYRSTNTVIHDGLCRARTFEVAAAC
jgi:hypothetical protein